PTTHAHTHGVAANGLASALSTTTAPEGFLVELYRRIIGDRFYRAVAATLAATAATALLLASLLVLAFSALAAATATTTATSTTSRARTRITVTALVSLLVATGAIARRAGIGRRTAVTDLGPASTVGTVRCGAAVADLRSCFPATRIGTGRGRGAAFVAPLTRIS
ncbi:MAG TPA: hypothetical protein QF651_01190, partial [Acidimicrobiales bacterium]|nr:hypothetical protein [Acidimicrobiales bacterium]